MKKFVNDPEEVVTEMLSGMVKAHPDIIRRLEGTACLVRTKAPIDGKVGLVIGGGSGHEPAHGGYVGEGMLDAAIAGNVFSSPPADQMYKAIKAVDSGNGVLCVIKNYTGDIVNFDVAREMAEAEGIETDQVIVTDDVAVEDSTHTTGRRGVAGTIFVYKIAGAKAEAGADLATVKSTAEKVIDNVRSMGAALSPCIIPARGEPNFALGEEEMELGIGIHGEPGVERRPIMSADDATSIVIENIFDDLTLKEGDKVAIMVNGMGATPLMELYIIYRKAHNILTNRGVLPERVFVGEYMTSLEMAGFSITLLKLDNELLNLLDAKVYTIAMSNKD